MRTRLLIGTLFVFLSGQLSWSQDRPVDRSLLDQQPFDSLTVDGQAVKVLPLPLPGRRIPADPDPRTKLRVTLLEDDEKEYEITWENIQSIQFFEQRLLEEAERLTEAERFDEAFAYFYRLETSYRGLKGVDLAVNRFLFLEARSLARSGQYTPALASLEELYRRAPDFRFRSGSPDLTTFLDRLIDRMVTGHFDDGEFAAARFAVVRAEEAYREEGLPSVGRWADRLQELAAERLELANSHLAKQDYRAAINTIREMRDIWPQVKGAPELDAQLAREYPVVTVGVLQLPRSFDTTRLDHWGDARAGALVHRSLVEYLGPGPEGGRYQFALGLVERSDDLRRLTFRINQQAAEQGLTGYEVADRLIDLATSSSTQFHAAWASLARSVAVENVNQVRVDLRRPHLLPEALLCLPLEPQPADGADSQSPVGDGRFEVVSSDQKEVRFLLKSFEEGSPLAEIAEVRVDTAHQGLSMLRRGRIDVLDRLFPADAIALKESMSPTGPLVVEQYGLPTLHMLIPAASNVFLADRDFRRALLFGIDRESILFNELLNGNEVPGCQVISGPFPRGSGDLSYAYDTTIAPRPYTPELANLLASVAVSRVVNRMNDDGEAPLERSPLVLGYPALETARVACQAIAGQLKVIGVDCELREFPPGIARDLEGGVDLTYVEVRVREPLVDADRLFGSQGLAADSNPHVSHALRTLKKALSWSEVSEGLRRVHRVVHDEVAVIPLWQMTNVFAYNKRLHNVGDRPLRLYENIDQWRIGRHVE